MLTKDLPAVAPIPFEGMNFNLTCEFSGTPLPQIKWLQNGDEITSNGNYILQNNNKVLTMKNLQRNIHDGQYQCEATNSAGTAKSSLLTFKTGCMSSLFVCIFKFTAF